MKNMVIFGSRNKKLMTQDPSIGMLEIEEIPVPCGLVGTKEPLFDTQAKENENNVLIKVRAFSCNYRDKALILSVVKTGIVHSFYVIGSEFVGEIVDFGPRVKDLKVGDRVIGNNHYTGIGIGPNKVVEGVPTNHASREFLVLHQEKVIKVPGNMPIDVAASFSIGSQTAYSMIRKLNVAQGENILVTSGRSNTSQFVINALRKYHVNIYATSTSKENEEKLKGMGVKEVIQVDPKEANWLKNTRMEEVVHKEGLFDCVIDPFFDLHVGKIIDLMAPRGRYITCGFYDQYQAATGKGFQYTGRKLLDILALAMIKNLQLIGNCIGLTEDLAAAIRDYEDGNLQVNVDSVFDGNQVADFLNRSYNDRNRFGKVVFRYD